MSSSDSSSKERTLVDELSNNLGLCTNNIPGSY